MIKSFFKKTQSNFYPNYPDNTVRIDFLRWGFLYRKSLIRVSGADDYSLCLECSSICEAKKILNFLSGVQFVNKSDLYPLGFVQE